jgi:S-adenosylmethionine:tRNA ribosyltransferase-isomerase
MRYNIFSIENYDYHLPEERIAQTPAARRDQSKLLVMDRETGKMTHLKFFDIYHLIESTDVLVINNTKVVPARLFGQKETGGKAEVLIIDFPDKTKNQIDEGECVCRCLIKAAKKPKSGDTLFFSQKLTAKILNFEGGIYTVRFLYQGKFDHILERIGHVPLPPYIQRGDDKKDRASYQTVYAAVKGAVAAPTAGLHFSKGLLEKLEKKGVTIVEITLHVGYGTFSPVRVSDIRDHRIHSEWYSISKDTADKINASKKAGHRIVAVGTTAVRTLEYACNENGMIAPGHGKCDLFIYPGFRFSLIDAMLTNFHLPKSTLLMLVSAFSTRENVLNAYQAAVDKKYRFYSYGDAMLIV